MPPKIDINSLSEAELADLNNRIVERLRFLQQARAHARMLDFSVGDKVSFQPDGYGTLFGVIAKYNRKTVTVVTENRQRWNVSPNLLRKVQDVADSDSREQNVVQLREK